MWPRVWTGYPEGWVSWRYRRAQRCWSVASRAQKRDTTRLKNQSEFTQTAEAGGDGCRAPNWAEKGAKAAVIGTWVPFERPSICWDICARRTTVFPAESGNKFFWLSTTKTATAAANSPIYIIQNISGQIPFIEDERWKDLAYKNEYAIRARFP